MTRKILLLVLLAIAAVAVGMTVASRDEIARYRAMREM